MEIEISSKKNDHETCIALSESACIEAVHHYLWALAIRAKRLSLRGDVWKREAIAAWKTLIDAAINNYKLFPDIKIKTKWVYSALNHLSNEYIAISEIDNALAVIEELTNTLICDYGEWKEKGEAAAAEEIRGNFRFYLHSCYNLCYRSNDNVIAKDLRFQTCETLLDRIV